MTLDSLFHISISFIQFSLSLLVILSLFVPFLFFMRKKRETNPKDGVPLEGEKAQSLSRTLDCICNLNLPIAYVLIKKITVNTSLILLYHLFTQTVYNGIRKGDKLNFVLLLVQI